MHSKCCFNFVYYSRLYVRQLLKSVNKFLECLNLKKIYESMTNYDFIKELFTNLDSFGKLHEYNSLSLN